MMSSTLAPSRDSHVLGPYRVLVRLGLGSAGTVCEAQHIRMGRLAAVKLLHPGVLERAGGTGTSAEPRVDGPAFRPVWAGRHPLLPADWASTLPRWFPRGQGTSPTP